MSKLSTKVTLMSLSRHVGSETYFSNSIPPPPHTHTKDTIVYCDNVSTLTFMATLFNINARNLLIWTSTLFMKMSLSITFRTFTSLLSTNMQTSSLKDCLVSYSSASDVVLMSPSSHSKCGGLLAIFVFII